MDAAISDEIFTHIQDEQPLVDAIRHYMFTFDDLLLIDPMAMKEVVAKIDRKLLVVALKGTSDQLKNHFLQCMSQRGGEMLREDMEAAGPVQNPRRGGRAAADPGRGAATGVPRRAQFERRRERSICRLKFCWGDQLPAQPVPWRMVTISADVTNAEPDGSEAEQEAVSKLDQARRDAFAEGLAAGRTAGRRADSSRDRRSRRSSGRTRAAERSDAR